MLRRCGLFVVVMLAAVGVAPLVVAAPRDDAKTDVIVWGERMGPDSKGFDARRKLFEKKYPQYNLKVLNMGAGEMNPQKLMTAIVGKVPPDVIFQDRFTISDWAHRNAFQPLDPYIEKDKADPSTPTADKYYPAAWNEAKYAGKLYAIPFGADDRVLYYNKKVFRESAVQLRAAGLDPERPPRTWGEVLAYSKVLTKFGPDGLVQRAGYIPNYGNTWLYLYSFQMNASWISPDGKTCTMGGPETEAALKYMKSGYQILGGYNEAQRFQSTLKGGADDAFITGKIAMKVDGDWIIADLAKYGPYLEFGTAPAPIPDDRYTKTGTFAGEKDQFITWIGGFSYAMPSGARNSQGGWDYIKFMSSPEAYRADCAAQRDWEAAKGRLFVPRNMARMDWNEINLKEFLPADPRFAGALRTHAEMMPYARIRPATPVGQVMWDEQVRAMEFACKGERTPSQALMISQEVVQSALDEVYSREKYSIIDLKVPAFIGLFGALTGIVIFYASYKRQRLGRLDATESRWGYIFIAPWLIGFLLFTLGPMLASLFFSFTNYDVLTDARWVGTENYSQLFHDKQQLLGKSLMNVLYLGGVGVPLGIITGLAIALLLNSAVRGIKFYRTIFYLPSIIPAVASTVLWVFILSPDPNKGLVANAWKETITAWFGVNPPAFFTVAEWAKPAVILMGLWGAGGGMILWLAGLKGISTTLYEAASIDGANPRQQFWNITLPQLSPLIFFNTVIGLIGALQTFESSYIITGGTSAGPSDSLLTVVYHLFRQGFYYFKMGSSSALAWVIFFIILALTGAQFLLGKRWVHYEGLK